MYRITSRLVIGCIRIMKSECRLALADIKVLDDGGSFLTGSLGIPSLDYPPSPYNPWASTAQS